MINLFNKKRIYLDYASSCPIDKRVSFVMRETNSLYANPNSIHTLGVRVREKIEESREKIARIINAHSDEIFFTGSGTESDALAILGTIEYFRSINGNIIPHIITSTIEHPAVLENCKLLEEKKEVEVTYINPDKDGIINPKDIKDVIKDNTILVSIMYANNEIGTIQKIEEIAKEIRHYKKHNNKTFPIFHTDACQALNYLFISNIEKLGVDMMSFNGAKIYGPKGIGVLYKKRNINISPIYKGGGQEMGLRSGTENVSSIVGLAKALEITELIKEKESKRLIQIRNYFINNINYIREKTGYKIILNGDKDARLPNNINISVLGISSELLVVELDAMGIEVSEKSACHSSDENSSYVIKAIRKTCSKNKEEGSVRISLGRGTKKMDIDYLISSLIKILNKYKNFKKS
ncbi:MAG: hypothetical protein O210_OD1C00001G0379 [Parcubacteria bacterium RAAC4_OD1_1]|nr:MAG: hypothetical protein O210_OD1C00001G0379 [Parcubacteria bacterium RAAC4_OD1_1]